MTASVEGLAAEPAAVAKLRGKMSRRAESAYFNEWDARAVVEYIDALASQPKDGELLALAEQLERDAAGCDRDGYEQAAIVKRDCARRIRTLASRRVEVDAERLLDALDDACINDEGRRVSWVGYTRDDRLKVIRAALTAALQPSGEECDGE